MSRLVARILLSMFLFPLGVMLYAITAAAVEAAFRSSTVYVPDRETTMFLVADLVTWAGVATYWCLLWRTGVPWTRRRIVGTCVAAAGAAGVGAVAGVAVAAAVMRGPDVSSFAIFLGGVMAILLWLFATVLLWRETAAERAARVGAAGLSTVTCPTCGYNLTGLADARCPECGSRFTLDELLAAQPSRAAAGELA